MKDYDVFVPYCCLVQVRVFTDELEEEAQAFEAVLQTLDEMGPILQFVDEAGAAVDSDLLDIVEGRYTKKLVYVDGFQNMVQKVGWSTSRPRTPKPVHSDSNAPRRDDSGCYRDPLAYFAAIDIARKLLGASVDADPHIRSGRPVIKGTRFLSSQVLAELSDDENISSIAEEYDLDRDKIAEFLQALAVILDQVPQG